LQHIHDGKREYLISCDEFEIGLSILEFFNVMFHKLSIYLLQLNNLAIMAFETMSCLAAVSEKNNVRKQRLFLTA
jgi:hypothetical protein